MMAVDSRLPSTHSPGNSSNVLWRGISTRPPPAGILGIQPGWFSSVGLARHAVAENLLEVSISGPRPSPCARFARTRLTAIV